MSKVAVKKVTYMDNHHLGYIILSALAGIYVGFGIILIFSVGGPFAMAGSAATKLVMGASFGVALTLVIFAGSELFTGNNMCGVIGALSGEITWWRVGKLFLLSYIGNFIGSFFLAYLVAKSGAVSGEAQTSLIMHVSAAKMNKPAVQLFLLGILCNWLVCLAVWTSAKTTNDMAKIFLIFWTLFAFISSGFEHSIANQTLLSLALFLPHGLEITWLGLGRNLFYVTLGNIVGGGFFVGALYYFSVTPSVAIKALSKDMAMEALETVDGNE
jgi:nitrite transporter NirC